MHLLFNGLFYIGAMVFLFNQTIPAQTFTGISYGYMFPIARYYSTSGVIPLDTTIIHPISYNKGVSFAFNIAHELKNGLEFGLNIQRYGRTTYMPKSTSSNRIQTDIFKVTGTIRCLHLEPFITVKNDKEKNSFPYARIAPSIAIFSSSLEHQVYKNTQNSAFSNTTYFYKGYYSLGASGSLGFSTRLTRINNGLRFQIEGKVLAAMLKAKKGTLISWKNSSSIAPSAISERDNKLPFSGIGLFFGLQYELFYDNK